MILCVGVGPALGEAQIPVQFPTGLLKQAALADAWLTEHRGDPADPLFKFPPHLDQLVELSFATD